MKHEEKLREMIRLALEQHLDEITTTANVAGYLTPNAFVGDKTDNASRIKQLAQKIGYTLTSRGKKDIKKGDTLKENYYYEYRNDTTKLPHQKIGTAISEINKQLKLVERALRMNARLKKEYGVSNDNLWKRTQHQMTKLEGKLMELAGRLREMRG